MSNPSWYVAVTTAPRTVCTLRQCVDSLILCGWNQVHVFAEPNCQPLEDTVWHQNQDCLGVWRNWKQTAEAALESGAEYILTVQDDSQFHYQSRQFTESVLTDKNLDGFLSLYTPKHYGAKGTGVLQITTRSLWGACAIVFPRQVLAELMDTPTARKWAGAPPKQPKPANGKRRTGKEKRAFAEYKRALFEKRRNNPQMIANSDTAIGKAMNYIGRPMYFVSPSPVQHIATHSTISHGSNDGRRNCSPCASLEQELMSQVGTDQLPQRKPLPKVTRKQQRPTVVVAKETKDLAKRIRINGLVLHVESHDGYWSRMLRATGFCKVKQVSDGVQSLNGQWVGQFDWVYARGVSAFKQTLDAEAHRAMERLVHYASKMWFVYWTDQSETNVTGKQFNYTREQLNQFLQQHGNVRSFFHQRFYHAAVTRCSST